MTYFELHDIANPLDFLYEQLKGKPRSSIDSEDRDMERPGCNPLFLSNALRRESNRNRRFHEAYSPQHSPCRHIPAMKLNSFMDREDTFEEDVDFLWPQRR